MNHLKIWLLYRLSKSIAKQERTLKRSKALRKRMVDSLSEDELLLYGQRQGYL